MRALSFLVLLAIGCSKSSTPDDDASIDESDDASMDARSDAREDGSPPDTAVDAPDAGPDPDAEVLPILVGSADGDGGVDPYEDGEDVSMLWGPQGGIMITPTLRFATADGWVGEQVYRVTIAHTPAPDHEASFGVEETLRTTVLELTPEAGEGFFELAGLFNPLSMTTLHDTWTHLDVTVEARGVRGSASASLHLVDPSEVGACATFPLRDDESGCRTREIPVTLRVVMLEPSGDGTIVHYTVTASEAAIECVPALGTGEERSSYQTASCLDGWMVGDDRMITTLQSGRCGTWDELVTECP